MHVSLTPELETLIKSKVETGLYNNASEVIREALRFMEMNKDLVYQMKLSHLRMHLAEGEQELASGQGLVLKDVQDTANFFNSLKN